MELNLRARKPFLAYLSACETGRNKDRWLDDANVNLISAFQMSGFRHVIGTLWEVADKTCVEMARETYDWMRMEGLSDTSVCRGLHKATRQLRDKWLAGTEAGLPEERGSRAANFEPDPPMYWVPYVHYGI